MAVLVESPPTLRTCWRWTERASSLMRSRALMIEYGSHVLRVVLTVMEPSIRSSWAGGGVRAGVRAGVGAGERAGVRAGGEGWREG